MYLSLNSFQSRLFFFGIPFVEYFTIFTYKCIEDGEMVVPSPNKHQIQMHNVQRIEYAIMFITCWEQQQQQQQQHNHYIIMYVLRWFCNGKCN